MTDAPPLLAGAGSALDVHPVTAILLTPLHYHSLAVQGGTATIAAFLGDRAMSYAMAAVLGDMRPTPILPTQKDYLRDMAGMRSLASVFVAREPRLMRPLGRRLNLDGEGGCSIKILQATSTGNLKTWFFIQEVPPGSVYDGAFFGEDPFAAASRVAGREVREIVIRSGRHLGGMIRVAPADATNDVRLNLHTGHMLGADLAARDTPRVAHPALYDFAVSEGMAPAEAAGVFGGWLEAGARTIAARPRLPAC